jgi:integrase
LRQAHSWTTHSAKGGWSIFKLQQYLGHKDPTSTAVYVHMTDRDVIDQFKKSSYFARSVTK